jgi:hypothetical protein
MNVQTALGQAGRLIEDVQRQARDYMGGTSETNEPNVGSLWEKALPDLDKALAAYNKMESPSTPESTWIPFGNSKARCQEELDKILDALLVILGTCGAAGYRRKIRNCQSEIAASRGRIGKCREQMLSAPTESIQNFFEGLLVPSQEGLKEQIADETGHVAEKTRQIQNLKIHFREHLQQIGISVTPDAADSFLLPVQDEIVSMAAVISNIGRLTEQLQRLVDESKEARSYTERYYGIYVLLVLAVDRIQKHFVRQIDENFIPDLDRLEQETGHVIAHAESELSKGGLKEQLSGNVVANRRNIHACKLMAEILQSHRRSIVDENRKLQSLVSAAVNSYRTVRISYGVAELIGECEAAFRALRGLRLPPMRTFKNVHLNEELQKLAERMVSKE